MEQSQYRHLGHCNHGWELKSASREAIGQRQDRREDVVEENLRSIRSKGAWEKSTNACELSRAWKKGREQYLYLWFSSCLRRQTWKGLFEDMKGPSQKPNILLPVSFNKVSIIDEEKLYRPTHLAPLPRNSRDPLQGKNTERGKKKKKKVLVEKSNSQPTIQSKMRRERRMQNRLMTVALFGNQNVSYLQSAARAEDN